jgi:general secretion pathway protein M
MKTRLDRYWKRLSPRERNFVLAAGMVGGGVLLYGLVQLPLMYQDRMRSLDRLIEQKREHLVRFAKMREEHERLKARVAAVEGRIGDTPGGFSLLSHLESVADQQQVRANIVYMRPQPSVTTELYKENGVEVKLEKVALEQILRVLSTLEGTGHPLRVKSLHLKRRFAEPHLLDVTFVVVAYEKIKS